MCWFLLSTTSFAGKCKVVEIRISTMFLIWKWSTHLWSGTRCCPKWKNLNILFKCEGRDTLGLYRSGMVNRELNLQVKMLIYRSIYIPVLTYGHMHWVVTARKRLQAQNSLSLKVGWYFPYWDGEDSHLGGVQTRAATQLLLLRTQFTWFSHTTGMPPGCIPSEVFQKRPQGRPWTYWRDICQLA